MNFQAVNQANGQSIDMMGTIVEIGPAKLTQNEKKYCSCKVVDQPVGHPAEKHNITIYAGNKGLPPTDWLNKTCLFSVATYQGRNGTAYKGFCNGLTASQPQNLPQQAFQQPAPQQPRPQSPGHPEDNGKTRPFALSYTKDLQVARTSAGSPMSASDFWETVLWFERYMATGKIPAIRNDSEEAVDEPEPDDIPF